MTYVIIQGNSERMVQNESIAVTAVINLFHKYRYNMKGKLSKLRRSSSLTNFK
jgi:hypothetical protein